MRYLGSFLLALLSVQVVVCCAAEPSRSLQLSPIAFEANRGQAPQKYSFLFHRDGLRAMFFANGADLVLCGKSGCDKKLALMFVGAHSVPNSIAALTGRANYFLGNDPSRWIRNVPLSWVIEYKELYPGISLSFYGNPGSGVYGTLGDASPVNIQAPTRRRPSTWTDENGNLWLFGGQGTDANGDLATLMI